MKISVVLVFILILGGVVLSGCESVDKAIRNCHMETKYETMNEKNCDATTGCECLSQSWAGLGACNSCKCAYQEEICN